MKYFDILFLKRHRYQFTIAFVYIRCRLLFPSQNVTSGKTNRKRTTRSNEFPSRLDEFPSKKKKHSIRWSVNKVFQNYIFIVISINRTLLIQSSKCNIMYQRNCENQNVIINFIHRCVLRALINNCQYCESCSIHNKPTQCLYSQPQNRL